MRDAGAVGATQPEVPASRSESLLGRASSALAILGGAVLVALAAVVTAGIGGRWLFGQEVPGAFELVQVGVAVSAFLFLPICQLRNGNVIVDSLTARANPRTRGALDATWASIYAAVAGFLAWRIALGGEETLRSGTVTSMLQLPFGWAIIVGAAALLFLAAISLFVAGRHLRGGR